MAHLVTVATCSLNQWALDYIENTARIIESIKQAKAAGAKLRVGPELEICGYGCLDHFLEQDLYLNCWEMLERILLDRECYDILLDIGMPVQHRNVRYNCRIICLNGKILLIRPKLWLANDGNYREMRHFTPWLRPQEHEEYHLPRMIQKLQGSSHVIFGDAVISTPETCFGAETCEELFTPDAPHTHMSLDGVEIITNSSGSHFTLRKLGIRLDLIKEATKKNGGVYLYSNQQGCDGDRLYYDGCAMIMVNGEVVAQGSQFSLNDVEVVTATIDLEEVRAYRSSISRGLQAAKSKVKYHRIQTDFELGSEDDDLDTAIRPTLPVQPRYHSPEEEIALCTGAYLWDYLRRSGTAGYLIPLSGGIDSCATATIVFSMCRMVIGACEAGNKQVIADVKRIAKYTKEIPKTPQELCNQILHTVYMGMSKQSSTETRSRARELADAIGSYHVNLDIDEIYNAQRNLVVNTLNFEPRFKTEKPPGTAAESLMLQNIQARIRMVTAYQFAQILPTTRQRPEAGGLLVLGSANVGESLRGYLTKYDCSSADINPIGSIDKSDLKRFIAWSETNFGIPCLRGFLTAVPTAELEPISDDYVQSDEADMGMTYDELTTFGRLRKYNKLGPYGMFQRLMHDWSKDRIRAPNDDGPAFEPAKIGEKVMNFFKFYAINRFVLLWPVV
ncbi:Glutamine-dependent NAD(+) synthetase [Hyphodiscus hymeniophilus]|uniref:Glutamine-dependent NAD(+) synthetase n=1 Tax=Hyphodiscus hymeniophilus TaxID=353542 RepID=A0A9P6VKS0_9HELO|nr:Glutamine-dependent NAD(+) synthetase [Hyphodiscus hymeniophilus]